VILARDGFDTAGVDVVIADGDGNDVKGGAATETPPDSGRWVYATTADVAPDTTVRIAVTVSDRAAGPSQAETERTV
jgi:hypothetical protein